MKTASYYLWKWADNNMSGNPNEVFADLVRGEMPPSLQVFDPEPVTHELQTTLVEGLTGNEEWTWQVCLDGSSSQARFVHASCLLKDNPAFSREPFLDRLDALGISGYDEQHGRLIECLSPKLNIFQSEQWWNEPHYDIDADELATLLRRLNSADPNPFACLQDRHGNFVQCMAHNRRYSVEWHERLDAKNWERTAPYRLECFPVPGKRRHFIPAGVKYSVVKGSDWVECATGRSDHETITFSETLAVFCTFLSGEPKPARYRWRDISKEIA